MRKSDVLLRGELREEVLKLEDEADVRVAEAGPFSGRELVERLPEDLDSARVGAIDSSEQVEERALSDARRPHDGGEHARLELEVEIPEHLDGSSLAEVRLRQRERLDREHRDRVLGSQFSVLG
jgi:hypothetical protein